MAAIGVLSACAVGTGLDDALGPDAVSGDGADAATETETGSSTFDAATSPDDANASPPETGTPQDTGSARDVGPQQDTGVVDADSGACSAAGFAGALLKFDLSSQPGNEPTAAVTMSANGATGSALSRGGALSPTSGSGSINSINWPAAIDPTRYYRWTVAPAAGCTLALTTLAVDLSASGTGPSTAAVATSVDNFAARQTVAATGTASISLAGVTATGAIEVRIYGYGASSSAGTFRVQNTLTLSGTLN